MIEFERVWKRYSKRRDEWALEEISFHIGPSEMVFLLGPSGVGKSTLLKLITLEEMPTTGTIRVADFVADELTRQDLPHLRRRCGMVFQDFRLIKDLTIHENLAFCLRMTGTLERSVIARAVARVLQSVGIYGKRDRFPRELSGGEQQRAAIARALIHEPPIILADEPTGNLDAETGNEIMALLQRLRVSGTTLVVASHQEPLAERFATRTMRLREGRIAEDRFLRPVGTEVY
ncbi:MAG: ATP-binding cassette domain-containing protein [Candidatus Eisenbacteria bacterium]|nr:ATP-binding cassette domain-containing protein [Candidatus Eisenbacteria bacterium]